MFSVTEGLCLFKTYFQIKYPVTHMGSLFPKFWSLGQPHKLYRLLALCLVTFYKSRIRLSYWIHQLFHHGIWKNKLRWKDSSHIPVFIVPEDDINATNRKKQSICLLSCEKLICYNFNIIVLLNTIYYLEPSCLILKNNMQPHTYNIQGSLLHSQGL